ncbi:MAG: flavin reductase family protein [Candidatus Arcticimaribacter sp.]
MQHFSKENIDALEIRYKNNLINSISGYKSANLIGTKSKAGNTNLAVFNSIVHLGSNPALLGFILRPTTVPRHSYENMKETGVFTINHISKDQIEDAHHTSAKYPENVSEFDQTNLKEEYKADCIAPFVKDAPVQIACRYVNDYLIKENDTLLVVGAVEHLFVQEEMLLEDGYVQLDKGEVVTVNGIDGYALPQLLARFPYARPKE